MPTMHEATYAYDAGATRIGTADRNMPTVIIDPDANRTGPTCDVVGRLKSQVTSKTGMPELELHKVIIRKLSAVSYCFLILIAFSTVGCQSSKATAAELVAFVRNGDLANVQSSIEGGSNIETKDGSDTLLLLALLNEQYSIARYLIAKGANVDAQGTQGVTPIMVSLKKGNNETFRQMLPKSVNLDQAQSQGFTALHFAAQAGNYEATKALLDAGAKVDIPNASGDTALSRATLKSSNEKVIGLLIARGADKTHKNRNGKTPQDIAAGRKAERLR